MISQYAVVHCWIQWLNFYRHPCVATVSDYVFLLFILCFYSPSFMLRNYSTDFRKFSELCILVKFE